VTFLVAGLGNPGPRYEVTRHNAGFIVVDHLGDDLGASYWKDEAGAKTAYVRHGDAEVVLAKPQSFMNVSGNAVSALAERYEVSLGQMIVVHDDIDLPEAAVRVKAGGGHGGHNGLRSLHQRLGSGDYLRVRVGVGRPPGRQDPADYVLEPMGAAAAEAMGEAALAGARAVLHIIDHGVQSAMNEFNGSEGRASTSGSRTDDS
jgi:peptidyl-tRNA hydrolase, PTH1 family